MSSVVSYCPYVRGNNELFAYTCPDGAVHYDTCDNYQPGVILYSHCSISHRPSCFVYDGLNLNTTTNCSVVSYTDHNVTCDCKVSDPSSDVAIVQIMTRTEPITNLTSTEFLFLKFDSSIAYHIGSMFLGALILCAIVFFRIPTTNIEPKKKVGPDMTFNKHLILDSYIPAISLERIHQNTFGSNFIKTYIGNKYIKKIFRGVFSPARSRSSVGRLMDEMRHNVPFIKVFNKKDTEVDFVWTLGFLSRCVFTIGFTLIFLQYFYPQDPSNTCGNSPVTVLDSPEECEVRTVEVGSWAPPRTCYWEHRWPELPIAFRFALTNTSIPLLSI